MRAIRTVVLMTFAFGAGAPCANAGDIDIGVTIAGEITPGVYGRVELGNRPAPRLQDGRAWRDSAPTKPDRSCPCK